MGHVKLGIARIYKMNLNGEKNLYLEIDIMGQESLTKYHSKRKPQMEEVPNLINIGPTNPIQILNQHNFF